jgi:hypothetical protein
LELASGALIMDPDMGITQQFNGVMHHVCDIPRSGAQPFPTAGIAGPGTHLPSTRPSQDVDGVALFDCRLGARGAPSPAVFVTHRMSSSPTSPVSRP